MPASNATSQICSNRQPHPSDPPAEQSITFSIGAAAMWIIAVMLVSLVVLAVATMLLERREAE
jgi:hypothetical protein